MDYPYLVVRDVEEIYERLLGSRKGINPFIKKAKGVAEKSSGGAYIFKDEQKLFEIINEHFSEMLDKKKIYSFSELMQYVC